MALHPGVNAEATNGATAVTVLAGPAAGISRLVTLASIYNRYWGADQPFTLYLENGGTAYNLYYDATLPFATNVLRPGATSNGPIILESGWDLRAVTSAAATDDIDLTVSYAEDAGDGDASSPYHIAGLEGGDAQYDTLVSEPSSGTVRIVRQVVFSNDDVVDHHYSLALYDGSTNYAVFMYLNVPAGSVGWVLGSGRSIVVPNGWEIQVMALIAEDTNPSHWTAHYMECNEDDSGEG